MGNPLFSSLTHRWSFNNTLTDSVGGVTAILNGNPSLATVPNQVTITGNGSSHVNYVALGNGSTNILPTTNTTFTVELWATLNTVENWARMIDFGSTAGGPSNLGWTWNQGVANPGVVFINSVNTNASTFTPGTQTHNTLVVTPSGTGSILTWYQMDNSGNVLNTGSYTSTTNISQLTQTNMWLGRSEYGGDLDANASYNEVRIWTAALTQAQLQTNSVLGPDALPSQGNNLLPSTTQLFIASGGTLAA
jgi:hypothetical protein